MNLKDNDVDCWLLKYAFPSQSLENLNLPSLFIPSKKFCVKNCKKLVNLNSFFLKFVDNNF